MAIIVDSPAALHAIAEDYRGKRMNHREYPRRLRDRSEAALRFIISDASAALRAYPHSGNASYYADEIHYAAAELRRRGIRE